ncbi:MAG: FAD-binding oxidoreductase [Gemmatimonadetes bacterium]|nr:FAD-binding oxidoreductase [Gemmatimonadota bacterium]
MRVMHLPEAPRSLWLDACAPYVPRPPPQEEIRVDVAIIGGGFTGLATAYELKRTDPGLRVAVLEAKEIAYGSSGRNGSFAMTVVGLGFSATAMLRGRDFLRRAHAYMMRAVDALDDLIQKEALECDRIRPGFLRMATSRPYMARLRREVELAERISARSTQTIGASQPQRPPRPPAPPAPPRHRLHTLLPWRPPIRLNLDSARTRAHRRKSAEMAFELPSLIPIPLPPPRWRCCITPTVTIAAR